MGIEGPFLNEYVDEIVKLMGDVYPEIVDNRELIRRVILSEEERFGATLRQGQVYLAEAFESSRAIRFPASRRLLCTILTASLSRLPRKCAPIVA